ncbi:MAG: 50S ribosomal protein L29 [Candidatus Saccharibacteria bacterium]|nr:50S ribosomal protein L29 [Candidatus Saccharibacteria bacterium]
MAKTKRNYREMSLEQLSETLVEAKSQLEQAKMSKFNNDLVNPDRIRALRREIARIQTAISDLIINESEEN